MPALSSAVTHARGRTTHMSPPRAPAQTAISTQMYANLRATYTHSHIFTHLHTYVHTNTHKYLTIGRKANFATPPSPTGRKTKGGGAEDEIPKHIQSQVRCYPVIPTSRHVTCEIRLTPGASKDPLRNSTRVSASTQMPEEFLCALQPQQ